MASPLREVLDHFEPGAPPVSLRGLAREMALDPGVLEEMLAYWVRKGRLREVNGTTHRACTQCGVKRACPFVLAMPRYYERVSDQDPRTLGPPCAVDDSSSA